MVQLNKRLVQLITCLDIISMTFQNKGRKRNDCVKEKKNHHDLRIYCLVWSLRQGKKIPFQFFRQNCFQIRRNQRRINSFNATLAIPGFACSFVLIHILGVINDESSVLRITIVLYDVGMSSGDIEERNISVGISIKNDKCWNFRKTKLSVFGRQQITTACCSHTQPDKVFLYVAMFSGTAGLCCRTRIQCAWDRCSRRVR